MLRKFGARDGFVYWDVEEFSIISIAPATDLLGVWADNDGRTDGLYTLTTSPIHFVGVAKVKTLHFRRPENGDRNKPGKEYEPPSFEHRVVGLDLCEGYFTACNEANNFAGLCKVGDDPYKNAGELSLSDYPLDRCAFEEDGECAASALASPPPPG